MRVKLKTLPHFEGLELPSYGTPWSAGFDIRAAVDPNEPFIIQPGVTMKIPTGICLEVPFGFVGVLKGRSSSDLSGLEIPVTWVDADYRGEVFILARCTRFRYHTIERGQRIAQMKMEQVTQVTFEVVPELSPTSRGNGGFGSTGRS